jgi:hypothetical protein
VELKGDRGKFGGGDMSFVMCGSLLQWRIQNRERKRGDKEGGGERKTEIIGGVEVTNGSHYHVHAM